MSFFGGKKQPEQQQPASRKEQQSWEDGLDSALPQKAAFFDAMRTDAYVNLNLLENHVEFWAALRVDPANDKWRVMHYMVYDLDRTDGKFVSETVIKDKETGRPKDVSFAEAVGHLARADFIASRLNNTAVDEFDDKYPADKYPEIKAHYHDLEHYKGVANIEGIAFNEHNEPYRRVEGKIVADATFQRQEIANTLLAVENARENPQVKAKIEGGIVADILNTSFNGKSSLDNKLLTGQILIEMDKFAVQVGALYLAAQTAAGSKNGYDKITGLTDEEKTGILEKVSSELPDSISERNACERALRYIIPAMKETLESAQELGVHTEPFQKFTAECELYMNLLQASKNLSALERAFVSASNSDSDMITGIRQSVDKAQRGFINLGGSMEQVDQLKAWVNNPSKESVPGWLPGFLSRYYESRGKIMEKFVQRKAGVTQVKVLPAEVKPPVTDEHNEGNLRSQREKPKAPKTPGNNP